VTRRVCEKIAQNVAQTNFLSKCCPTQIFWQNVAQPKLFCQNEYTNFKNIFVANAFISPFRTQTTHITYVSHFIHSSTAMFPKKPYTLAGIEPGFSHS
jgi:hypothetical protein